MPKAEWGVKRTCSSCSARFYDLMRDPIICPKCGAQLDISVSPKPKRAKPRAAVKVAAERVVEKADDLVDDSDDVDSNDNDDDDAALDTDAGNDDEDDGDVIAAKGGDDDEDASDSEGIDDDVLLDSDDDDAGISDVKTGNAKTGADEPKDN